MANIPLLNKQRTAKAQTQVADRSGLIAEQQRGIKQFGDNIQKIIKNTASLIDTKIYESESANAQKEILGFMSESNNEKDKSDFFKKNNTMAGFHTFQAKKNLDNIEKRLSKISHPKARKELESKLVFQAQKSMIGDLSDENRSLKIETNLKEQDKNHILGVEVMGMKSPNNDLEFNSTVQKRINDISKQLDEGFVDGVTAKRLVIDVKDTANTLRSRALVEGGNPLAALKQTKNGDFGTFEARVKAQSYVKSKQLDGMKRSYEQQKLQNNAIKVENERIKLEIDTQIQTIQLDDSLSGPEKIRATNELRDRYKGEINSAHFRLFNNANVRTSRNLMSGAMARVNSMPLDELNSKTFENSMDSLRGIATNPDVPDNIRKQATTAMNQVAKKKKAHEKIIQTDAYKLLLKDPLGGGKILHNKILKKITSDQRYKDLPTEGRVEIYELYRDGKDKKYINLNRENLKTPYGELEEPFAFSGPKALEKFNKDPDKFERLVKKSIAMRKTSSFFNRSLTKNQVDAIYSRFKKNFDDYRQKVDNFENLESQILDKYRSNKVADK